MKPAPAEQLDIFASRAKYRPLVDSRLEFPRLSTKDHGADYDAGIDRDRLGVQLRAIRTLMLDGKWRTVQEVAEATGAPENSAQAQLRHLRRPVHGSHVVEKRKRSGALNEYRVRDLADALGEWLGVLSGGKDTER